jgi:hypothetical protein
MTTLKDHIAGKGITSRDAALEEFWAKHRLYNGGRRSPPESFITVKQVRQVHSNAGDSFDVFYEVPSHIINEANDRRLKASQEAHA